MRDDKAPPPYLTRSDEEETVELPEHKAHFQRQVRPRQPGKPGRDGYVPTAKVSKRVRALAMLGVNKAMIAQDAGISINTLNKYYARELEQGELEAYAQVAGRLFKKAMDGDTIAMIFWMKARIGWKDKPDQIQHNHTHTISHEERLRLLEAGPEIPQAPQDDGPHDMEEAIRPRWTETGSEIIDAEDEPEELEGDALEAAESVTRSYAEQVALAKKAESGEDPQDG